MRYMIQVIKTHIMRDGVKIGYIDGKHIFDHNGKRLAYFSETEVLDESGKRVAHVVGEYVYFSRTDTKARIEDNNKLISGVVSDACRAAIRLMLG